LLGHAAERIDQYNHKNDLNIKVCYGICSVGCHEDPKSLIVILKLPLHKAEKILNMKQFEFSLSQDELQFHT